MPAPVPPAHLLALTEATEASAMAWIVGGVAAFVLLGSGLNGWVSVVQFFAGKKPDLSKLATRAELQALEAELRREHVQDLEAFKLSMAELNATITRELASVKTDLREVFQEMRALHRSLGRAEGEIDATLRPAKTTRSKA